MTDQPTSVPVWQDGDPTMEAIAAAVWEHCEKQHGSGIVIDDPRNIAVAAVAGIQDAARTAARQTTGQDDSDPTTADDPTPLRWGLGDVLHGDDDTTIVCFSGPDREPYWLELDPERAAAFRRDLAPPGDCPQCGDTGACNGGPCAHPAVGQPAEAHDTEARTRQLILNCLTGRAVCPVPRPVDEATGLLDAYRAAILTAAADRFAAFDLHTEAAALRRMAVEDER